MHFKNVNIHVEASTFPNGKIPSQFKAGVAAIDMYAALNMLGSVTIPGGFSVASTASQWAWIRYLSALSPHADLAITRPFLDLDPHQKTVLSDDFGVAVTTQWLASVLGGFKLVVDGRKFILNYAHLLNHATPEPKKVGPRKSPDFVILDNAGKWHVIECKGSQTSVSNSRRQLDRAVEQKGVIELGPALAGLRLAAGLYAAPDDSDLLSQITVYDPEVDSPLVRVADNEKALRAARKIATARSLGLAGFTRLAEEVDFAETNDPRLRTFLSKRERAQADVPAGERMQIAHDDLQRSRVTFSIADQQYSGRQFSTSIPLPEYGYELRQVTVRQGVRVQFLEIIRSSAVNSLLELVDVAAAQAIGSEKIVSTSSEAGVTILQGELFASSLSFD